DADEAARLRSQVKLRVRANYSSPPTHGAAVVNCILSDDARRAAWEGEVAGMRGRIKQMRAALVDSLREAGVQSDVSFINEQRGMFSYMGLNRDQMVRLREEFGVYGVESGRLCVAALNPSNLAMVSAALAVIMRG
ncbi:MAG: aminotransferase class I/II-fold pyridoxal phosphate-dependent enzyme, partial [Micrococcales bacterium]|nr:aminotransferase class I/II-fold pyridoxal phosphate-dependent enzyme [Micrococcales bacterium]